MTMPPVIESRKRATMKVESAFGKHLASAQRRQLVGGFVSTEIAGSIQPRMTVLLTLMV